MLSIEAARQPMSLSTPVPPLTDRSVVVTGVGAVSAGGTGVASLFEAAVSGRSKAAAREFRSKAPACFPVCPAPDIDLTPAEWRPLRKMDRSVQLAWLAANEAWRQAGVAAAHEPGRIGIMVGSSRGPLEKRFEGLTLADGQRPPPSLVADTTFAALSGALVRALGTRGPGAMISATCASSGFAIAFAAEQILLGNADAMLVGGTEAPLHAALLAQMDSAGVLGSHPLPEKTCRPFDESRNGLVLGEGSGFMVLEAADAAEARRAPVLARLAGWGTGTDESGRSGVDPEGAGLVQVMRRALQRAGLQPDQIDYINAHGTGTRLNDAMEARAVMKMFGANVPCSSTKPITGHCLGATSALEAIICIETLRRQLLPPTANCEAQDAHCPINVLPLKARPARVAATMSNSLGFWGYHASLIFCAP
jgi:3-oxoacyl-[acyl-carrier-protein] synthase II